VGDAAYVSNQSINGMLWRVAGHGGAPIAWAVLVAVLGGAALWLARSWWLAGERAGAVGLAGLAGLFASPVSWDHHWVAAAPLLVGLLGTARRRRVAIAAALVAGAVFCSRVIFRVPDLEHATWHEPLRLLVGNAYLLAGVLLLVGALAARPRSELP
jgi:alpha-1,2-mannosyltransferase